MTDVENVGDRSEEKGKLQVMDLHYRPIWKSLCPGSSLKGMLRTILLSRDILKIGRNIELNTGKVRGVIWK